MPRGERIKWDAPASETVAQAREDISLREWCRARREAGESTADLAAALGVRVETIQRAMRAEPSAGADVPKRKPGAAKREEPADNIGTEVTAGNEEPAPPNPAPAEAPPADDGASVFAAITFIRAAGLWEQFEGFCLCLRWRGDGGRGHADTA